MFGKLGLGLGLGGGVSNPIPDTAPEMSFGANSTNMFQLAWQGQPTSGDINTLVNGGFLTYTGTISASYNAGGYWQFVITSGAKITIKQFRKLTILYSNQAGMIWHYQGALPRSLNDLVLWGSNIFWEYMGALPPNMTNRITLVGSNIKWKYSGALNDSLNQLILEGVNIEWQYNGSLPTNPYRLRLDGTKINWTGWGVQAPFTFAPRILNNYYNQINIGNSPVATEAETAHFLTELEKVAANNTGDTITLTFKKTTPITSEQYLPIIQAFTSKNYNIVLGS